MIDKDYLLKHYNELVTEEEQAMHMIKAGIDCDCFNQNYEECIRQFGEEKTKLGLDMYNRYYRSN